MSCLLLLGQAACDAATRLACVTLRGDPTFDACTVLLASMLCRYACNSRLYLDKTWRNGHISSWFPPTTRFQIPNTCMSEFPASWNSSHWCKVHSMIREFMQVRNPEIWFSIHTTWVYLAVWENLIQLTWPHASSERSWLWHEPNNAARRRGESYQRILALRIVVVTV